MRPEFISLSRERNTAEKGAALLLTLILLALFSIIVPAMLWFMSTGLQTTYFVYNPKADELYAADAGVREAMWRISHQDVYPLPSEDITTSVNGLPLNENGKDITVSISTDTDDDLLVYRILSTASDPVTGRQTSIDAMVYELSLTSFVDNVLTCPTEVPIAPGTLIEGNGHDLWLPEGWRGNNVTINADVNSEPIVGWPSVNSFIEFFSSKVDKTLPVPSYIVNGVIEVSDNMSIGPFYYEGNLTIKKANGPGIPAGDLRVNLAGTVYVKGSLSIAKNIVLDLYQGPTPGMNPATTIDNPSEPVTEGASELTVISTAGFPNTGQILIGGANPEYLTYTGIDTILNTITLEQTTSKVHQNLDPVTAILQVPNTIFIEGDPDTWNFNSTPDCTINGPGAIIAVGGIKFLPKVDADSGFIYVMSLDGIMDFQPDANSSSGFTGSVAAKEFNPMGSSEYSYPPEGYPLDMDIPLGPEQTIIGGIASWKIY